VHCLAESSITGRANHALTEPIEDEEVLSMALYMDSGNQVTLAPGAIAYSNWQYPGAVDTGPNYVSAFWLGGDDNYGTVTTVQTSVVAYYTTQYGYYWPTGIKYESQMRNDSAWSVLIGLNIGNFQ